MDVVSKIINAKKEIINNLVTYNKASNEGGAVYAEGGSIIIGIEGCTDTNSKHTAPNTHPLVTGNEAVFGGGGFVTDGTVLMYCGVLKSNTSNNDGTGNNVYMTGGTFELAGGQIGEETNPGIVLVGGQLNDTRQDDTTEEEITITMVYHPGLQNTDEISSPENELSQVVAGPYHPAFRQLVESNVWYDIILEKIKKLSVKVKQVEVTVHPLDVNNVVGHKRENILKLKDTYDVILKVKQDKNMKKGKYEIKIADVYTDFYEEHSKKKN